MAKIRHLAIAVNDPDAALKFYTEAFGFKEIGFSDNERIRGYFLTDGTINIVVAKFKTDQIGKGLDYTGLHHFGVVVDDTKAWLKKLEDMGLLCIDGRDGAPAGRHAEIKFRGPDGVVFDITGSPWAGGEPDV